MIFYITAIGGVMEENNKHNLLYFEGSSMRELYEAMDTWQKKHDKRLQSVDIQRDGDMFCCIALSNPTEVVLVSGFGTDQAHVVRSHLLITSNLPFGVGVLNQPV
jgi:hypothetical protein